MNGREADLLESLYNKPTLETTFPVSRVLSQASWTAKKGNSVLTITPLSFTSKSQSVSTPTRPVSARTSLKRRPVPLQATQSFSLDQLGCETAKTDPRTAKPTLATTTAQQSYPPTSSRFLTMPNNEEAIRTRSPLAEGSGTPAAISASVQLANSNLISIKNSSNPSPLLSKPVLPPAPLRSPSYSSTLPSPCFLHSHLDSSVTENVKREEDAKKKKERRERKTKTEGELLTSTVEEESESDGSSTTTTGSEEEDPKNSLTRQLAETAVSVREMSKQLGRARVKSHVQSIMIITKARDNHLIRLTRELALWLMQTPRNGRDRGVTVYVDTQLKKSKRFDAEGLEKEFPELFRPAPRRYSRTSSSTSVNSDTGFKRNVPNGLQPLQDFTKKNATGNETKPATTERKTNGEEGQLRYWTNEMCTKSPHLFDYVVTLGGDGTVLYASWLFQHVVPPVIPFALGSLGFLTNFDFAQYSGVLNNAIDNGIRVNLRMRFSCTVFRAIEGETNQRRAVRSGKTGGIFMNSLGKAGWESIESSDNSKQQGRQGGRNGKDKEIKCFMTKAVESFEVLNDLVVDRGPSPYVSLLELFGDEHHMTTVQADGLTVSTPTGSTAYSLSAGGSLVHPEIPALLITPICPHTLSFRPMLLPDSMELRICVPYNSRSTAWASFDGRGRVELKQGDHIKVTASAYPFPTVCADKQSTDWFHSISRTLRWNERKKQSSFVILEQGHKKERTNTEEDTENINPEPNRLATSNGFDEEGSNSSSAEDDDDDDAEEEGYDIDDLSSESTPNTNPASPIIQPVDPIPVRRLPTLSRPPSNDSDLTTMAKIQDERDRFLTTNPLPKPRRLSARHTQSPMATPILSDSISSSATPASPRSPNSNPSPILSASTTRRRERGEEGDRDFINESLAFKRNVGATASGKRRSGVPSSPKSQDLTPTTSSNIVAAEGKTDGDRDIERERELGDYAFAIFGCDFSDASDNE